MRALPWLVGFSAGAAAACACRGPSKPPHQRSVVGAKSPVQLITGDAGAAGPSGEEVEPNDTDGSATPLALGQTIRGKIDPETDVDRYRIPVAAAGALSVMVSAVPVDLAFELEDPSGQVVARSDRGGDRTREGVPNFGVQPGAYIAVVREIAHKHKRGRAGSAAAESPPSYEVTAQMVAPQPNAEHEPDEDRGTANEFAIGDTGTGFMGWTGDTDVWKFSVETLAAANAIDVEVSPVDGVGFELDLADGVGTSVLHRKAPRGAGIVVRGVVPEAPAGAPPYHYITLKATGSNPEAPYTLRVIGHVIGTDAELEPNDTPEAPMAWPADRTVVHGTWTPGDVDCYALPPEQAAHDVTATIAPSGDLALIGELHVAGQIAAASAGGGKGAAQKLTDTVPANAPAIVCVKGADERAQAEGTYDITVQDGA